LFWDFFAWSVLNRFMSAVVSAVFFCLIFFFLLEVDRVVCPTCQKSFFSLRIDDSFF
jgi:hypothetical protein